MKVGLYTDSEKMPNLALMKLSSFHKMKGDEVDFYTPIFMNTFDKVYYSKIFTFTETAKFYMPNVEKGGTGFDILKQLPEEIDSLYPDYSIYPQFDYAIGFITRGCIRNCKWCVVPKKEGNIKPYRKVEEIARNDTNKIVFMDNNILASDFGLSEIEKLTKLKYRVDFNQGLDVRLVDDNIGKLLSKLKWIKYIRFSCDTKAQLEELLRVKEILNKYGYNKKIFVYVLGTTFDDTLHRLNFLKQNNFTPFMQPYIDFENDNKVDKELKHMARWCNKKWIFESCSYEEYKYSNKSGGNNESN